MLSLCGMEIATVHARDVLEPQKAFPKAIFISVFIIVTSLMLGSLAIAFVIPANDLSLIAGIMQAFEAFFKAYHLTWLLPVMALCLVIGGLGSVSNWIIAPTRGLLLAGRDGNLPPQLATVNRYGAPQRLLVGQAMIVTLLSSAFVLMPTINAGYWFLTVLAAQLYMLMYMLMFVTVIVQRYRFPNKKRFYQIPGGKPGIWLVAGLGFMASLLTFVIGFVPPEGIHVGSTLRYDGFLLAGLFIMTKPAWLMYRYRRPHWKVQDEPLAATAS
jgi:amino acid transporter